MALSSGFIPAFNHHSDIYVNTSVIHRSDLIRAMNKETLGERLRATRKAKHLTQAQLAQKAHLSQGTIGNIESGIRGYGESLLDIAKVLGVSAEYLRMETDDPEIAPASNDSNVPASLTARQIALLQLFEGLTSKQQDEYFRNLENTKQANAELIEELTRKRQQK
ncbi:helix-turn-helix domain-containing protein [Herbaspirillum frisingense]|uniref:helix-turn-helix domain-containing protein n=1 Tax=Herbaspirillum frisingense TaxID=92645 RepID=UPI0039AFC8A0